MAFTVSFQYGASTPISVTYGITVAKAKAMTLRYANRHGLTQAGMTDEQIAQAVIDHKIRGMAEESSSAQKSELIAAQIAAVEATVVADNTLNP